MCLGLVFALAILCNALLAAASLFFGFLARNPCRKSYSAGIICGGRLKAEGLKAPRTADASQHRLLWAVGTVQSELQNGI